MHEMCHGFNPIILFFRRESGAGSAFRQAVQLIEIPVRLGPAPIRVKTRRGRISVFRRPWGSDRFKDLFNVLFNGLP